MTLSVEGERAVPVQRVSADEGGDPALVQLQERSGSSGRPDLGHLLLQRADADHEERER